MKTAINYKRGGCLVIVVVVLGGKGGVRLPCLHRCLRAAKRTKRGAEDNNDDCGRRGRVVIVVEGRGKRLGGKGGRGKGWQGDNQ